MKVKSSKEPKKAKTMSQKIQAAQDLESIMASMTKEQLVEFMSKMGA